MVSRSRHNKQSSGTVIGRLLVLLAGLVASMAVAKATELPSSVKYVLTHRNLPPDSLSIYVERLENAEPVIDWNADVPRNPASVMKTLTTLVALETLGPAFRWKTELYFLGPVEDGTLNGDLLMRGMGDPFLVTERFWSMLRNIRQEGIRDIDGERRLLRIDQG